MTPESQEPECPDDVRAWMFQRFPHAVPIESIEKLRDDMPPRVRSWWDMWCAWRKELDEWRKTRPVDEDLSRLRYRMFGGRWLRWPHCDAETLVLEEHEDGEVTLYAMRVAPRLMESLAEQGVATDKLRELASLLYERDRIRTRADIPVARFVRQLLEDKLESK